MKQILERYAPSGIFQTLLLIAMVPFFVWYLQYHWNRRRLYKMASSFSGPLWLPFFGNLLYFVGSPSDFLYKLICLANTYNSPIRMWIGQQLFILVSTPEEMEIILNNPHALEKGELYKQMAYGIGTGLFTAPVEKWKRNRKLIMPTLNQRILNEFVPIFVEQSTIFLDQLKKEIGNGTFDISYYVNRCTLDIVCETTMGIKVDTQTTDRDFLNFTNRAMEITFLRMTNLWLRSDFIFKMTSYSKELDDNIQKAKYFSESVIREKRKMYQNQREDQKRLLQEYVGTDIPKTHAFFEQLIELNEQGVHFTDEELSDEGTFMILAGSETTTSTISFLFVMLGMFPEVQEKVYQEVLDVLGPDRSVETSDLSRFQYMERVIKETMRVFPTAPVLVRSVTNDINLGTCVIPSGSSVLTTILHAHWNEKYWPEPMKFDPDRFLPEEVAKRHPYSWLPFSGGPRNCIGIQYAYMSMKSLIATVVRRYQFSTSYQSIEDIKLSMQLVLRPANGYMVSLKLR